MRKLMSKGYVLIVGLLLAQGSVALMYEAVPSFTRIDEKNCPECSILNNQAYVPFPGEELPLKENLLNRISGYAMGDSLVGAPQLDRTPSFGPRPQWDWEKEGHSFLKDPVFNFIGTGTPTFGTQPVTVPVLFPY